MPQAREELAELVAIRSVADPRQFPPEECERAAQWVLDRFAALGFTDARLAETADGSNAVVGSRPCAAARRAHGAALRPLRRAATARRRRLGDAALRADREGRALVRTRDGRLQGQHPHAPHRAPRPRRGRAREPQAGGGGLRGAGHRRPGGLRGRQPRPAPRGHDPGLRHRERRRRPAGRDRQPARHGQRGRHGRGAGLGGALRHVRRCRPGRPRGPGRDAGQPARRGRQHHHRRPGQHPALGGPALPARAVPRRRRTAGRRAAAR